jgi:hypothetical protein
MFASNDWVIQIEIVHGISGILKVELDQVDSIGEGIQWELFSLCNCNETILLILNVVTWEHSQRFELTLDCSIVQ